MGRGGSAQGKAEDRHCVSAGVAEDDEEEQEMQIVFHNGEHVFS